MEKKELDYLLEDLKTTIFKDIFKKNRIKSNKVVLAQIKTEYFVFLKDMAKEIGTSKTQLINDAINLFIESYEEIYEMSI